MIRVASLHAYPVKSMGGVSFPAWPVEARGLRGDRRWMLIDDDGVFVSQRTLPQMCRYRVCLDENGLEVYAPDGASLAIPPADPKGDRIDVAVWKCQTVGTHLSNEADAWFSERLGASLRLVYMPDDVVRPTNPEFSRSGDHVSFADGYPILVVSQASLDDLNARLDEPLPMNRFRPNVVVDGCEPYAEDGWTAFGIGDLTFRAAKPCARCPIPTINQDTAESAQEPLRTLATFRRFDGKVYFGLNVIPEGSGLLNVGDAVEIER